MSKFADFYNVSCEFSDLTAPEHDRTGQAAGILLGARFMARTTEAPGEIDLKLAYSFSHPSHTQLRLDRRVSRVLPNPPSIPVVHRNLQYDVGHTNFLWDAPRSYLQARVELSPDTHRNDDPEGFHHLGTALGLAIGQVVLRQVQIISIINSSFCYYFSSRYEDWHQPLPPALQLSRAIPALEKGFQELPR